MDHVYIKQISVECVVGVDAAERTRTQPLEIDLRLAKNTAPAAASGRLDDAVDYREVATRVAALCVFRRFELLETAAEEVAAVLLATYRIAHVEVSVFKPLALAGLARGAGVEIQRSLADLRNTDGDSGRPFVETATGSASVLAVGPHEAVPDPAGELRWLATGSLVPAQATAGPLGAVLDDTRYRAGDSGARLIAICRAG